MDTNYDGDFIQKICQRMITRLESLLERKLLRRKGSVPLLPRKYSWSTFQRSDSVKKHR
jgi:hypothetical protein